MCEFVVRPDIAHPGGSDSTRLRGLKLHNGCRRNSPLRPIRRAPHIVCSRSVVSRDNAQLIIQRQRLQFDAGRKRRRRGGLRIAVRRKISVGSRGRCTDKGASGPPGADVRGSPVVTVDARSFRSCIRDPNHFEATYVSYQREASPGVCAAQAVVRASLPQAASLEFALAALTL